MQRYISRRLIQMIIALFLMSVIVFLLGRLSGDPVSMLLSQYSTEEDRVRITEQLGLNKPVVEQYGIFIFNALKGDLGKSVAGDNRPALALILERFPASLKLALVALIHKHPHWHTTGSSVSCKKRVVFGCISKVGSFAGTVLAGFLAWDCLDVFLQCETSFVTHFRVRRHTTFYFARGYDGFIHSGRCDPLDPFKHVGSSRQRVYKARPDQRGIGSDRDLEACLKKQSDARHYLYGYFFRNDDHWSRGD